MSSGSPTIPPERQQEIDALDTMTVLERYLRNDEKRTHLTRANEELKGRQLLLRGLDAMSGSRTSTNQTSEGYIP